MNKKTSLHPMTGWIFTMARRLPAIYLDADLQQANHAYGVINEYTAQMSTHAFIETVLEATHKEFAVRFDKHIGLLARASGAKQHFHHVYEYSPTGGAYDFIGMRVHQLWTHRVLKGKGSTREFTWNWKPAKHPIPTYQQRRNSRVGDDPIRHIPKRTFDRLIELSENKRYTFIWKAQILEYQIPRTVYPRRANKRLAVAIGDRLEILPLFRQVGQPPGDTRGAFTSAWTTFWTTVPQAEFKNVLGQKIERDAKRNIERAINSKKPRPRARTRSWNVNVVKDTRQAYEAGRQQAITAMKGQLRSIKRVEASRGDFDSYG